MLANVVLEPAAAFRDIAARPRSGIAFLALVLLRFASVIAFYHPDLTFLRLMAGLLFQVVSIAPLTIVTATFLWVAAIAWRSRMRWSAAFSVVVHVMFAYNLATVMIASVAGALLPATVDVDLRHPPFTNLGSVLNADAWPALRLLLVEADVRSAYAFVLTWFGVRAARSDGNGRTALRVVASCFVGGIAFLVVAELLRS